MCLKSYLLNNSPDYLIEIVCLSFQRRDLFKIYLTAYGNNIKVIQQNYFAMKIHHN